LEVRYFLQAQERAWPNYVGDRVLAPGVPSVVLDGSGAYYLYFAAFDPLDAPLLQGNFDPSHRRPYFIHLQVNVPANTSVIAATDAELATWVTTIQ
jgi:hypothetical protein